MTTAAEKASFQFLAPQLSGRQEVVKVSANSTAQRVALTDHLATAELPTAREGKFVIVTVKANGGEAFIAFKDGTAAASVSNSTGFPLNDGDERSYWLNLDHINDLEYISDSTADIFFYLSSPFC